LSGTRYYYYFVLKSLHFWHLIYFSLFQESFYVYLESRKSTGLAFGGSL